MYNFTPEQQYALEKSVAPIAVYQFINKRVKTIMLSAGFLELFGFKTFEEAYHVMDNDMYRDTHPDDAPRIASEAVRFAKDEIPNYKVIYRSMLNGEYHIIHAEGKHIVMPTGERIAFVWYFDEGPYSEIFGNQGQFDLRYNRILKASSDSETHYDYLTGMPTMSYFVDLAKEGCREIRENGKTPVMLFFDLCGIRNFNRRYGFAEGDKLIKALSRLLASHFSNENCSRFGQDQFVIYTDGDNIEQRINEVLSESDKLNNGLNTLIRVGIYVYDDEKISIRVACDRAKVACDVVRNTQTNTFNYFDEELRKRIEMDQYIVDNLDKAISERWIQAYYQPIVRAVNGKVCDEEALSRWHDPVKGLLSPGVFIPVLERTNQVYKLDLCIIEQVLEKIRAQMDKGLYVVPTSVNLSRTDFDACDIVEEIRKRVDASGVGRDKITIEITESAICRDLEVMKKQIERFQDLGFKVWIDDFGTGYSAVNVLQELHFDLIKLDMYFMHQFDTSPKNRIIITELIKMAIGLGVETVMEGVETEEQKEFLTEAGCTKLQGYYYCKPIPEKQVFERYEKGIQIGFENPEESEYYAAIGNTNLYDLSDEKPEEFAKNRFFQTLPMAIVETKGKSIRYIRKNKAFQDFIDRIVPGFKINEDSKYPFDYLGPIFAGTMRKCLKDGGKHIAKERLRNGMIIDFMVRRISENPVTKRSSLSIAILECTDFSEVSFDNEEKIPTDSFVYALTADYTFLYYVDLDTEHFIEYIPNEQTGELEIIRHGVNFFAQVKKDAKTVVYKDDVQKVINEFTKDNVVATLGNKQSFNLAYRLVTPEGPKYVSMKVSSMGTEGNRVVIGVNSIEAQMKAAEFYERERYQKKDL
jgi:diguanylate cyclase (GGDEF)-like protein